jgi:hypothetical protein
MKAIDLINELKRDSEYQTMITEKLRKAKEAELYLKAHEAPLLNAIHDVLGVRLDSVWDLVNGPASYAIILDLLADHLVRNYDYRTREAIARALTVKEARGGRIPNVLFDELKKHHTTASVFEENYRDALINALIFIGDRSILKDVVMLAEDVRYQSVSKGLAHLICVLKRKSRAGASHNDKTR